MPLKRKITSLLNKSGDLSLQLFLLITLGYVLIILSIFTYRYQKLKQIEQKNIEKKNQRDFQRIFLINRKVSI